MTSLEFQLGVNAAFDACLLVAGVFGAAGLGIFDDAIPTSHPVPAGAGLRGEDQGGGRGDCGTIGPEEDDDDQFDEREV